MLGNQFSFWLFLSIAVAAGLLQWRRKGFALSLGTAMSVSLLAGTWFAFDVAGVPLDVRSAIAVMFLSFFAFMRPRSLFARLSFVDVLLGSLFAWGVLVDSYHDGFSLRIPAVTYGEWVLPYAAGRFAMFHRSSLVTLSPWFATVAAAMGLAALFECWSGVNFWENLFTPVDDLVARVRGTRYGFMHRAIGPTRHPIFLAVQLMLMLPWVVSCWFSSTRTSIRILASAPIMLVLMGIVATVSRGPILAIPLACVLVACAYLPKLRIPSLFFVAACLGISAVQFDRIVEIFDSNVREQMPAQVVETNGAESVYTGTRSRLFVLQVFGPLVLEGGPLGYGTKDVSTFPPNIPGLPASAKSREILGVVDNSFVLIGLRYGWIGLTLFAGLFVAAISQSVAIRRTMQTLFEDGGEVFVTMLGCVLAATALELLTVFWAYDMSFWVLFHFGVIAGLTSFSSLSTRGEIK